MKILIQNGNPVNASCTGFEKRELWIENGRFTAPGGTPDRVIDARGAYLMPGLIDLHTHGSMGVNYSKPGAFDKALLYAAGQGVTTVLPTVGARPMEEFLAAIVHILDQQSRKLPGAAIGGIHLEGPFVSPAKKGAMNDPEIPCTLEHFRTLYAAGNGQIKIMTVAPELENALSLIAEGAKKGIRMSIGHTEATHDQAMAAIRAGATGATHLFNAMNGFNHREPGAVGAALTEPAVTCEAICDLIHLAPATVKLIRAAKGVEGMILVSDSGMITGLGDGTYDVDGKLRIVKDGISRNPQGTIAGSCYSMADGARQLVKLGFPLYEIARLGALNPAKAIGLTDRGTLQNGHWADLIFCDEHFNVRRVFARGREIEGAKNV